MVVVSSSRSPSPNEKLSDITVFGVIGAILCLHLADTYIEALGAKNVSSKQRLELAKFFAPIVRAHMGGY